MPRYPWNRVRDEELPEELRDKTPEEIAAALKKAKDLETQVAALTTDKTTLETNVTQLTDSVNQTRNRIAELEARGRQPNPPAPPAGPTAVPSIWDDETAAMQHHINNRVAPMETAVVNTGMLTAKMYAQQQLQQASLTDKNYKDAPKIFRKYESEIDAIIAKEHPSRQIIPATWINAFIYVRGLHLPDILDAATKGDGTFFAEPGGGAPPPPAAPPADTLSERELQIAGRMRLTPAQYLEQKKKMTFSAV